MAHTVTCVCPGLGASLARVPLCGAWVCTDYAACHSLEAVLSAAQHYYYYYYCYYYYYYYYFYYYYYYYYGGP